jgi:hypothetical protein
MMIYMTRIQNMSFFLLKVNNPFVRHPVWPRREPRLATLSRHSSGTASGPRWAPRPAPSGPSSGHPVWPPPSGHPVWPPVGHPVWPPSGTLSSQRRVEKNKNNFFYFIFLLLLPAGKEGKKYFSFRFSIPKIPKFPELRGLCGRSREKKKVFLA